eukprot:scaffold497_cov97-Cylindrotheca_fusiformis.AAC.3
METAIPHAGSAEECVNSSSNKTNNAATRPTIRRTATTTGRLLSLRLAFRILTLFLVIWILACIATMKYVFLFRHNDSTSTSLPIMHPKTSFENNNDHNDRKKKTPANFLGNAELKIHKPPSTMGNSRLVLTVPSYYNKHIFIQLRPDWSPGSIHYLHRLVVEQSCATCSFFRILKNHEKEKEKAMLLGNLKNDKVPLNTEPGICQANSTVAAAAAAAMDDNKNCHGPILERGMVGWVGGTPGGPDFFINLYEDSLIELGANHTVFGQVVDERSFHLLEEFLDEDTFEKGSIAFVDVIHFHLDID